MRKRVNVANGRSGATRHAGRSFASGAGRLARVWQLTFGQVVSKLPSSPICPQEASCSPSEPLMVEPLSALGRAAVGVAQGKKGLV